MTVIAMKTICIRVQMEGESIQAIERAIDDLANRYLKCTPKYRIPRLRPEDEVRILSRDIAT